MTEDREFEAVASLEDILEDGQKLVAVRGRAVLLCRSEGQVFAVENRCSHDGEPLAGGRIRKCTVVCPHHGARFSLKNGAVLGPPAFAAIKTFPVRLTEENIVEVSLD